MGVPGEVGWLGIGHQHLGTQGTPRGCAGRINQKIALVVILFSVRWSASSTDFFVRPSVRYTVSFPNAYGSSEQWAHILIAMTIEYRRCNKRSTYFFKI